MAEAEVKPEEINAEEEKDQTDDSTDKLSTKEDEKDSKEEVKNDAKEEVKNDAKEEVKNDAKEESTDEISKLESDIIRQVEYYFSDANLMRDKFLMEKISETEDGWVAFTVLLTFKRLAALTTDVDVIVNALHKSDEGLVEISDDKTKIRRHPERPVPELNEEVRKEVSSRTAYAKGFPLDAEISDLIEFFQPFEKVVNIYMRKYLDKPTKSYKFKGSVFVTFAKKEQCEAFINKDKVEYKGTDLIRKWQDQYFEEKKGERAAKKKDKPKPEDKITLPTGTVLKFDGGEESVSRETIKEAIEKLEFDVAHIAYTKGDKSGHVRLIKQSSAKEFLEKLEENKLKLSETVELTFDTISEEEEKEFLQEAKKSIFSRRNQNHQKPKGGRKRRGHDDHESSKKKQKA